MHRKETRWFTESDLEPLTKNQLIHVIISGVQGFEGMERTIGWNHGDSCSECQSIAKQLRRTNGMSEDTSILEDMKAVKELSIKIEGGKHDE